MYILTQNIGYTQIQKNSNLSILEDPVSIKRILISRPNSRLGNQLLITPLIQELERLFPHCKVDLFIRGGVAPIIFKNYNSIDRIIALPKKPFSNLLDYLNVWLNLRNVEYDLIINTVVNSSSGRLSTKLARGKFKFYNNDLQELYDKYGDYIHIAKFPVYNVRHFLSGLSSTTDNVEIPTLDIRLSDKEIRNGKEILNSIVNNNKKTIGIYTFATGNKCYAKEWWKNTYNDLIKKYGEEYNIVEVLPVENVSQIDFAAPSFYSRDIREIASVIRNLEIFVTADCGIMHLASSANIPVIGLFSVTNINRYHPYGNNSIALNTNNSNIEDIIAAIDKILDENKKDISQ